MSFSSDDQIRRIVDSLRPGETDRSHSNSLADMAIIAEEVGVQTIRLMNGTDQMAKNHTALMEAGWNGIKCIGPISVENAVRMQKSGEPFPCNRTIPKLRRREVRHAYRCTGCQEAKEEKEKKTRRR